MYMDEIFKSPTRTDGSENLELINELLDDESPLLFVEHPPGAATSSDRSNDGSPTSSMTEENTTIKRLVSTVYSGPTLVDIENALSVNSAINPKTHLHEQLSPARISSVLGRGLSKAENRYTLKIKSTGNGKAANDGYRWRKYGQKSIKNSPYTRSYYRCTKPRCGAKKQVERSLDDPNTLMITYEGLHHHFIYPYCLIGQPQHGNSNGGPPLKKRERKTVSSKTVQEDKKIIHEQADGGETNKGVRRETDTTHKCQESDSPTPSEQEQRGEILMDRKLGQTREVGPQGLLDDLVPMVIEKISASFDTSYNSSSSCLSYPSTAPSPPLFSRSWSSTYFNLLPDLGMN